MLFENSAGCHQDKVTEGRLANGGLKVYHVQLLLYTATQVEHLLVMLYMISMEMCVC